MEALPPGALVADVGCGNGKYFGVRRDAFVLGSDRSEGESEGCGVREDCMRVGASHWLTAWLPRPAVTQSMPHPAPAAGLARVAVRRLEPAPAGERLRADVAVADGLALPYRGASCDGALCIAVLHHIASPSRRLALLAQLLRILRPGGRALVTVWATEQENMRKVRGWRPVAAPGCALAEGAEAAGAAGAAAAIDGVAGAAELPAACAGSVGAQPGQAAGEGSAVASGDYFVPWHLPFHRAEAAAAAREANDGARQHAAAGEAAGAGAPAGPRLDGSKGAVVFQRYYHLFERGELDGLVRRLPGAALVDSFYDKDNW